LPIDLARQQILAQMETEHTKLNNEHQNANTAMIWLALITCGIYLLASSALAKKKEREELIQQSLQKINDFKGEIAGIKKNFAEQKRTLRGIYSSSALIK
jgi:ABC-type Fe3+-hydroxamate transport system substrate-binding protein